MYMYCIIECIFKWIVNDYFNIVLILGISDLYVKFKIDGK